MTNNYSTTRKTNYIDCTECASKLNREILAKSRPLNVYPICSLTLRPVSIKEGEVARFSKAKKAIQEGNKRLAKSNKNIRWLKIEYHT